MNQVPAVVEDVVRVFQAYVLFNGDTVKTALTVQLSRETVEQLEASGNWKQRLLEVETIAHGDISQSQIQFNRAINYVQAARMREVLDRVVSKLAVHNPDGLMDLLTTRRTVGKGDEARTVETLNLRPLTDLAKAIECVQAMTATTLGDTAGERGEINDGPKRGKPSVAISVAAALKAADQVGLSSVAAVRDTLKKPAELPAHAGSPANQSGP